MRLTKIGSGLIRRSRLLVFCLTAVIVSSPAEGARVLRITGRPENQIADAVLKQLLSSPLAGTAPRLHYQVELVKSKIANAYSFPSGEILITSGLFWVLKDQQGVWAAAIGHELGHMIEDNPASLAQFQAALRRDYEQAASRQETLPEKENNETLESINKLTAAKDRHGQESAADFIGLVLMAEAGYEPGFAVVLDQRMRAGLGDASGLVAAMQHHPRWSDRVQSAGESNRVAMALFASRWPDASHSPGGDPPPYGVIRHVTASDSGPRQAHGGVDISTSIDVHNTQRGAIRVAAEFSDARLHILHAASSGKASNTPLVLTGFLTPPRDGMATITLTLPPHALATAEDRVTGIIFLMSGREVLDIANVPVKLPPD
jgi:hypothetical protein